MNSGLIVKCYTPIPMNYGGLLLLHIKPSLRWNIIGVHSLGAENQSVKNVSVWGKSSINLRVER